MNNRLYGNSGGSVPNGVGICGSSIQNLIIGNTIFNNPDNYQFVCNAFSQFYGEGPTLVQNSVLNPSVPILTPIDIPQTVDRIRFLVQSLVDDLI